MEGDDDDDDTRVLYVTKGINVNVPIPIMSAPGSGTWSLLKHPVLSEPAEREKSLDMFVI